MNPQVVVKLPVESTASALFQFANLKIFAHKPTFSNDGIVVLVLIESIACVVKLEPKMLSRIAAITSFRQWQVYHQWKSISQHGNRGRAFPRLNYPLSNYKRRIKVSGLMIDD